MVSEMRALMRPGLEDNYGFLPLQNAILNIMQDVDRICDTNKIQYCLMGGSALGAKRHGGFIPWDDDLDIFMTPDNYEKFRESMRNADYSGKYYLQEWGQAKGMVTIAKVRLNDSSYIEKDLKNWNIHQGIYIDIFILHICPDNILSRLWQYAWAKYLILRGCANRHYNRRGGGIAVALKIMRLFPRRFLLGYALKQVYRYRNKRTSCYCNYLGKALMKNGTYKRAYFEKVKRVPFETITLCVPEKLEEFLTERFGDYMKIPDAARIKYEQHAETWCIDRCFANFSKNGVYPDEKFLI